MSVYADLQEIHVGEDVPFEADYDPCAEPTPPDLTGMHFEFMMVPIDGTGATITKTCTITDTVIKWTVDAADSIGRLGEVFRAQLRRIDADLNRVWLQFNVKIVD